VFDEKRKETFQEMDCAVAFAVGGALLAKFPNAFFTGGSGGLPLAARSCSRAANYLLLCIGLPDFLAVIAKPRIKGMCFAVDWNAGALVLIGLWNKQPH